MIKILQTNVNDDCGFLSGVAVCHVHMVGVGLEEVGRHAVPVHLHLHTQHCVKLLILHNTTVYSNQHKESVCYLFGK